MMQTKRPAAQIYLMMALFTGVVYKVTFTMSAIYRVEVVKLDILQLVLLGTVVELTVFLFEIPTGVIADVYSRRLSVILGTAIMGVGFILEGVFPLFVPVLLAQVVWGIGWTFVSGARSAWITDEVGMEQAGKLFLSGRQVLTIGNLVGIVLAVPLARVSLRLPYFVGGGLFLLLAVFLVLRMDEAGFQPAPQETRQSWREMAVTARSGYDLIRSRATLVWYALIALFVGLYSEGWDRLKEPYLLTNYTFPEFAGIPLGAVEWFAILSIAANLLVIGATQIARSRIDTANSLGLARALQVMYALMVAAMIGFALTNWFWAAVGCLLFFDTLRTITFPLSEAYLNHKVDSSVRATVLSMTGQIDALGQMSGGPLIGTLGKLFSIPAAILASAGILFPTIPLFSLLLSREKRDSLEATNDSR
jgi:DHA3 family tetracycline resistance protein-like MFS transporter